MEFRTEIRLSESENKIDFRDPIVTVGSCFSDDIGVQLRDNKFKVSKNPFGTIYNPLSIHELLLNSINSNGPSGSNFVMRDDTWFHYDFHSMWHGGSKQELLSKLMEINEKVHSDLKDCKYLIITYGTSWVYERKETGEVVSNCHKIPQKQFEKRLVTQKKIIESFDGLYSALKNYNKDLRIMLTVSPVRHTKDSIELNSVSKSILRLSCHTLCEMFQDVEYFPSYEIIMDDLRDYRFYKPDLIHPSEVAIEYIWEKFGDKYFDESTSRFIQEWRKIKSALQHKPFQSNSPAHQQFLKEVLIKLNQLKDQVDVQEEIDFIQNQIQ